MTTEEWKPTEIDHDLIRAFPLRPIRSTEEHDRAIEIVTALADPRDSLRPEEFEYFIALCLIIGKYESEIYPDPEGD